MHGRVSHRGKNGLRGGLLAALAAALLMPVAVHAQTAGLGAAGELVDPDNLRVCADPANLPFSHKNGQGFENKIAELVAKETGRKAVTYTWFPMATGFVRNTLGAHRCDVIMGYAQGDELVQNTNAYYRSAYVLIYKKNSGLDGVDTIEDPRLRSKRIGVVANTPPVFNMAAAHLLNNMHSYDLMIDARLVKSSGELMVSDLVSGQIDAGILWGPMAGYFVRKSGADLAVVPLVKEKTGPRMAYRITMGVRRSDQDWKRTLNSFIRKHQGEINKILLDYGVPLIDEHDNPITQ